MKKYTKYEEAELLYPNIEYTVLQDYYHRYRHDWRAYKDFADYMLNAHGIIKED